jgi:hemerythrin-like metal-binding protein
MVVTKFVTKEIIMSFFIWKNSFNTNIPEIDIQHRYIFTVLNRLYDAVQASSEIYYVKQLFNEMNEYAADHFTTEEKLMAQSGYPGLESQLKQHEYYKEQMVYLSGAIEEKNPAVCRDLLQFLKDWFINHILQEDLKFAEVMERQQEYILDTGQRGVPDVRGFLNPAHQQRYKGLEKQ